MLLNAWVVLSGCFCLVPSANTASDPFIWWKGKLTRELLPNKDKWHPDRIWKCMNFSIVFKLVWRVWNFCYLTSNFISWAFCHWVKGVDKRYVVILRSTSFLRYYKARLISNSVVSSACVGSCTRLLMCTRLNSKINICIVFALLPSPPGKMSWVVGFSLKVIQRNSRFGLEWLRKQSAVYIMRGRLWGIWWCFISLGKCSAIWDHVHKILLQYIF